MHPMNIDGVAYFKPDTRKNAIRKNDDDLSMTKSRENIVKSSISREAYANLSISDLFQPSNRDLVFKRLQT